MGNIKSVPRLAILGVSVLVVIIIAVTVYFYFSTKDSLVLNFSDQQSLQDFVGKKDGAIYGEPKFVKDSVGAAIKLDGKSYIDCGRSDKLIDVLDNVTIAAWIKPKKVLSNLSDTIIVMKGNHIFGLTRDERAGTSDVVLGYINSGSNHVKAYIIQEQWNHVVLVHDRNIPNKNIKIYVNGVIRGERDYSEPILANVDHIFVGGDGKNNFNGLIGNVKFYNNALTEDEVKKMQQNAANPSGN